MDPFSPFGQQSQFETFDPYGGYDAATLAALYGGSCDPDQNININCGC
ncbi:hypothetical protein [Longimicrobium sp.]|nr:hypothetical protein [Longimicrobium sp.]HEX6039008.1 hypothetical protein [Longimicrobium sp.]